LESDEEMEESLEGEDDDIDDDEEDHSEEEDYELEQDEDDSQEEEELRQVLLCNKMSLSVLITQSFDCLNTQNTWGP
jgi:hypothetical protein